MTQNSPVPDWFGKAEADQRQTHAAKTRGLGCGLGALLGLVAAGSLYWAVTAQLRVNGLEARLRSQQAEEAQRRVEQARERAAETRERAALPVLIPAPAIAVPAPATAATALPDPATGAAAPPMDDAPPAGQRSAAEIQKEMSRLRPAFRRCYDLVLNDHPTASGRLSLALVISARGNVTSATASPTGNLPPSVGTCVVRVARTASFGPADGPTNVTYPLTFQSG